MIKKVEKSKREISSFRDPAGYIYYEDNKVIRRVNKEYFKQYEHLMTSGLYDELVEKGYLIKHREIDGNKEYKLLEVEKVPFISYPYEWCYDEVKDAAILTLNIQEIALKYNMILKDASSYNVQFIGGKAIFIDTLSFDFYEEGMPWGAYGQFVRHFMAPLLLNTYVDERCSSLLRNYIDGFPLDLVNNLLKNRGGFTARMHIKWHNKSIDKNNDVSDGVKKVNISKISIINMNQMMLRQISKLRRKVTDTEWDNYYNVTNYDEVSDKCKIKLVKEYLEEIDFNNESLVYDLGANDGKYSRIANERCQNVVSFDIDTNCVNRNYLIERDKERSGILPLLLDINNPSGGIGFGCTERKSINDRGRVDCLMALALIHHIVISNNVPFESVARWFIKLSKYLIIEFVPKEDKQVLKLLKTRRDIFSEYDQESFERIFSKYYKIVKKDNIKNSKRVLYLMQVNEDEE